MLVLTILCSVSCRNNVPNLVDLTYRSNIQITSLYLYVFSWRRGNAAITPIAQQVSWYFLTFVLLLWSLIKASLR